MRLRGYAHALVAVAVAASPLALPSASAAAGVPACAAPSGYAPSEVFVWIGTTGDWGDAASWTNNGAHNVPGARMFANGDSSQPQPAEDVQHQFVCIGGHALVTMGPGESASVEGLAVSGSATVHLQHSSKLFLGGSDSPPVSVVGTNALLWADGAEIGGYGRLNVSGLLRLTGSPGGGSATLTTRECEFPPEGGPPEPSWEDACPAAVTGTPGQVDIERHGRMLVNGARIGGVGVLDRRVIVNRGDVRFAGVGYFAMDDGTAFLSSSTARLTLAGSKGIYEGFSRYGEPEADLNFAGGSIVKKTSSATDIVAGSVTFDPAPAITIRAGGLWIEGHAVPKASLAPGNSYGEGACASGTAACGGTEPQGALVHVPGNRRFTRSSHLAVAEGAVVNDPVKRPVVLRHAVLRATRSHPAVVHLVYAAAALGSHSVADLRVQTWNGRRYVRLANCRSKGRIPAGRVACFQYWRSMSAGVEGVVHAVAASRFRAV